MISELIGKSVAQFDVLQKLKKTRNSKDRRSPDRCFKVEPTEWKQSYMFMKEAGILRAARHV